MNLKQFRRQKLPRGYFKKRKHEPETERPPDIAKIKLNHIFDEHANTIRMIKMLVSMLCMGAIVIQGSATELETTIEPDLKVLSLETTIAPYVNHNGTGNCLSLHVRGDITDLDYLRGCQVIEGNLIISILEDETEESYLNYTFPSLVEITGYLMLYRVSGIKTFYTMFPNLSVIRGTMLFKDYSLIVYECEELETLGFYKLLTIERGHIRIEKNSQLCFADRIDWSLISGAGEHFIDKNKRTRHCNPCSTTCPRTDQANKIFLCWDDKHCQNKCKSDCKTKICSPNGTCCDESCVGGCDDDNLSKCKACKKVKVVEGDSFTCAEKCPPGKFEYLNRRCLTRHECFERNSIVKKDITNISQFSSPFIPHNGFCERGCPPNHFEDRTVKNETICTRCGVECLKRCAAPVIDSIAAAQSLKSCAYIDGALEIQIRSRSFDQAASIVKELEKSLSDIEVIEDYLKVARSFPLRSLSFLKRLRRIKGTRLESNKFALVIWDNQNLQELWIDDQKLQIDRGKFFFHLNPRLCFNLIENLANSSTQIENYENAKLNNGDKTPCNITVLDVTVVQIYPQAVLLTWPPLKLDDERSLLSYVIYYTPTLQKNVTLWEGRDACGNDGWMVDDIKDYTMNNEISYPMTRLEPHTMYAYYVTAFTLSTEKTGAQSSIDYFKTLPGKPQTVRKFTVTPRSSSALDLKWDPPLKVHGELSHYIIRARIKVNADSLDPARDYCEKPIDESQAKPQNKYEEQQKSSIFAECDCDTCYNTCEKPRKEGDDQRQLAIDFENEIQDFTWTKVTNDEPVVRAKRQAPSKKEAGSSPLEFPFEMSTEQNKKKEADARSIKESKWEEGGYYSEIYKEISVNEPTTFEMTELRHYTQYQIWVVACRALYDRSDPLYKKADHYDPEDNPCGPSATINELTLKKEGSDDIHIFNAEAVTNGSSGLINVTWKPPTDPNGHIASYTVRYKKSDIENTKWESICVHYNKTFHILNHLSNGNYSIEVAAISLGGHGNFTTMKYVLINETTGNTLMWAVLWSFLFILVMITIALVYFIKRHYLKNISNMKLIANVNPDYAGVHYKQDDWEVARDKIIQLQELGQGSFGMVYEGIVKDLKIDGSETRCAIKTVNENATDKERISFLNEASVMKKFDTAFVVRLLGVVSQSQPTMVIMELMQCGDLKGFLRSHRSDYDRGDNEPIPNPPTVRQIVQMSAEIADGMSYLSAMKFVHRDLAARNCMVSEALTVKIGDFGMTRDIYETDYYRKGTKGLLPVRWMSPESLKDGVFTSSSDVFSFGVVLWEMATLASQPYQGLSNDQVLRYVIEGGVMERPENCPDKLYELMRRCWHHRPSARPTFIEIIEMFIDEVNQNFRNVAFYFSKDGQDALHQNRQSGYSVNITDDVTTPLRQDEEDTSSTDNNRFLMEDLNSGRKFHEL